MKLYNPITVAYDTRNFPLYLGSIFCAMLLFCGFAILVTFLIKVKLVLLLSVLSVFGAFVVSRVIYAILKGK